MNKHLSDILQDCLEAVEKGDSLDDVLARYSSAAASLRPLLEAAQAARSVNLPPASQNAATLGRARVLTATARLRARSAPRRRTGTALRVSFVIAAVLGFLVMTAVGLGSVSAQALPGDVLYPLKRTFENTRLQFSPDPIAQEELQEEFNQLRVEETHTLILDGRIESVEFHGTVTAQITDGWMVAGIPVIINSQTNVTGIIAVGVEVDVTGQTMPDGRVQAASLEVRDSHGGGGSTGTQNSEDNDTSGSHDSGSQGIGTPVPTPSGSSDGGASKTPEPKSTDSSGSQGGSTSTLGPTDSSGSNSGPTKTPEPTKTPDPTKTPEPTQTPH